MAYALWRALQHTWQSDDAFISFRYAENLVRGLGLVYNVGERVEGYSNFLWTMWTAFGLWLGIDAETWTTTAGIACFIASLSLLAWNSWALRREAPGPVIGISIAAMLAALHPDWQIFATGGLETSLFALEMTLAYVILASGPPGPVRAGSAGWVVVFMSMTRPEGFILAVPVALFLLIAAGRRRSSLFAFAAAFLALWIPYTLWRVTYFGDFFPNTYYAKSAGAAWYSQGAVYIALYFARYWPLVLGPALVALAWPRAAAGGDRVWEVAHDPWRRRVTLATLLLLSYLAFVVRVGGDFMFGRFLIPVTPILFALLELGVVRVAPAPSRVPWLLAGLAAAGLLLTPYPLPRDPRGDVRGIVFEPNFYPRDVAEEAKRRGLAVRPFFEGLPVRIAFHGTEARFAYYARPSVAIECTTGLTDHVIARQPLKKRGRIGHEKEASVEYVLGVRRTHFTFTPEPETVLPLAREIPRVEIEMNGVRGLVLTWDAALMDSLRSRGAHFPDFPTELDKVLANPDRFRQSRDEGWCTVNKLDRYYFTQTRDPRRRSLLQLREDQAKSPDQGGDRTRRAD